MKVRYRFQAILFAVLAALVFTSVAGAAPRNGNAVVNLSVEQGVFAASQEVLVTVTISNPSKQPVKILRWFTPAEGVEEPLFAVMRDGEPVAYLGAIYKRPAVTGKDYLVLKSGESLTRTVNLGDYYDLSQSGQYEIFYAVASYALFDEKGNAFNYRDTLTSQAIGLQVEGRNRKRPTPTPTPPPGGTTFNACTTAQQSILINARSQATTYSSDALSYLNANKQGSRYTTWFGAITTTRYATATSHFGSIKDAFVNAGITFDCGCKQNYYAYVYPNQPYKIYLCKVFWQAPLQGTDSQGGTLIHEMSHFNVVASTDDYVYGQSGAMNLASTDPDKAIDNADNHEYFAENDPSLP